MIRIAKILRFLLFLIIAVIVIVPTAGYLLLTSQWGQRKLCGVAEEQLSQWLGTSVEIDRIGLTPINIITAYDVKVSDDNGATALSIASIDARFELWDFIFNDKIIIDYATINSPTLHLYRADRQSPINIANIIEHLKTEPDKEPTAFNLRLNNIEILNCAVTYDVASQPPTPGRFNPDHIAVSALNIDAFVPRITEAEYHVILQKLQFSEQCGFVLDNLQCELQLDKSHIDLSSLKIKLPQSFISVADMSYPISGYADIARIGTEKPASIAIGDGSHVYLPDLKAFMPLLDELPYDIDINFEASGTIDDIALDLQASDSQHIFGLDLAGRMAELRDIEVATFDGVEFELSTRPAVISQLSALGLLNLQPKAARLVNSLGDTRLTGSVTGGVSDADFDLKLTSALAAASAAGHITHPRSSQHFTILADCNVDSLSLGTVLDNNDFNQLSGALSIDATVKGKKIEGMASADLRRFDFKGHRYSSISAEATSDDNYYTLRADVADRFADIDLNAAAHIDNGMYYTSLDASVKALNTDSLNLTGIMPGFSISGDIMVEASGRSLRQFDLDANIFGLTVTRADGKCLRFDSIDIDADNSADGGQIQLASDLVDASLQGRYDPTALGADITAMLARIMPIINSPEPVDDALRGVNDFNFSVDVHSPDVLCGFFGLPLTVTDEATVRGFVNSELGNANLRIEAPWIINGDKVIERTSLVADIEGASAALRATSLIPTKKGDLDVVANINGHNGVLDTKINWEIVRSIPINGIINFSTRLYRSDGKAAAQIDFENSEITFGDEVWNINPSSLRYSNNNLYVNNLKLSTPTQQICINGIGGDSLTDELIVDLKNIELNNIFETLEINKALICGYATGRITARGLLSPDPEIFSSDFKIKDVGYNNCVLGNGDVNLEISDGAKLFTFDAVVVDDKGNKSHLDGSIYIPDELLNINIHANHVKVGFMKPFMDAFTSDVSGYASGDAQIFGTFSDLDMSGEIITDSLRVKIDFTNTWYSAADSIHIEPGRIVLRDVTIKDDYGNTAQLNGWVEHRYFHDPTFDFNITDARNFLCYDETEKNSPDWYGRIFGNGRATVTGRPGIVDIGVNMTTTENSVFTFVLSDLEEATEYSFITFRDATPKADVDTVEQYVYIPSKVRELKSRGSGGNVESSTAYNMDILVDITPQAQMILVMDPVGGDRIRANGTGNMRMTYASTDNDLRLYGTYTLDRGSYNFTLQDIIIKDFTIKDGSSIAFNGDPYSAQLDIKAYYQVNANLSDLDESFLQDKELNRTNVPVRALMLVTGDMRQPDIAFDLEFPTLTQDTYRKVRSIVSTEDMMNRQIIYLLALNRFYTPEYMASTTKGNELFSVASSTIASQLSSMLGKLSENWSIAPNLRSERGDFSDLEVDLNLSSSLLNNRLLFNGNFGYRDKTMNDNQFIGDFDIEALLNRSGSWRFKAYNRYNDQNYYLRTAQTTQGIGLVYRRDFDNILSWLGLRKQPSALDTAPDTIPAQGAGNQVIVGLRPADDTENIPASRPDDNPSTISPDPQSTHDNE